MLADLDLYLNRARELDVDANFFLSRPYLTFFEAECHSDGDWTWVEDSMGAMFPPLPLREGVSSRPPIEDAWTDFADWKSEVSGRLVDYEFIYNPDRFLFIRGSEWATFRKNCRKWPRERDWTYGDVESESVRTLVADWLERHESDAMDPDLIVEFILNRPPGTHRRVLMDEDRAAAVNVWDENHRYVNYRLCICSEDPFVSEFARLSFYTSAEIVDCGKLVNDGGSLESRGLDAFKRKLHPIRIREVRGWVRS